MAKKTIWQRIKGWFKGEDDKKKKKAALPATRVTMNQAKAQSNSPRRAYIDTVRGKDVKDEMRSLNSAYKAKKFDYADMTESIDNKLKVTPPTSKAALPTSNTAPKLPAVDKRLANTVRKSEAKDRKNISAPSTGQRSKQWKVKTEADEAGKRLTEYYKSQGSKANTYQNVKTKKYIPPEPTEGWFRVKTPEEMVESGDYMYADAPINPMTPSADERPTVVPSEQGYTKMYEGDFGRNLISLAYGTAMKGYTLDVLDRLMASSPYASDQAAYEAYQKNKSKGWETAGELLGTLASFGGSFGAYEKAVTKMGGKMLPKMAEKLAEKKLFQALGKKGVEKAFGKQLFKAGGKEFAEKTVEKYVKEAALKKAEQFLGATAADLLQDATMGTIYDVTKASEEYEPFTEEWWKQVKKNKKTSIFFNSLFALGRIGKGITPQELTAISRAEVAAKNAPDAVIRNADEASRAVAKNSDVKVSLKRKRKTDVRLDKAVPEAVEEPSVNVGRITRNRRGIEIRADEATNTRPANALVPRDPDSPMPLYDASDLPQETEVAFPWEMPEHPSVVEKPSDILRGYSSTGSKKQLSEAQRYIDELVRNGDTAGARAEINRVVDDVVRNTKNIEPVDATVAEIKALLKETPISVPDRLKADVGYKSGGYGNFRKTNYGSLVLTEKGRPVDDLWLSLQGRYGRILFPDEISHPSEQLQYLADLTKAKPKKVPLDDSEASYLRKQLSNWLWETSNSGEYPPFEMSDEAWERLQAASRYMEEEDLAEAGRRIRSEEAPKPKADATVETKPKPKADATAETKPKPKPKADAEQPKLSVAEERAALKKKYNARKKQLQEEWAKWERGESKYSAYDIEEMGKELDELNDQIAKLDKQIKAEKTAAPRPKKNPTKNKATVKSNEPEPNSLIAREAADDAGEATRSGERTEFRRDNTESAREQARARRADNSRPNATQESFDADYDEFTRVANENRAKIDELKGRLRAATTEEERTTIQSQIDALNEEVRRGYRRASMRYHPDRGGSNEWMRKFNEAYDNYRHGSYSSRGFESAHSSQRASSNASNRTYKRYKSASANGGGNTPPPGGGKASTGGFKKPRGKATKGEPRKAYTVEDYVAKSRTHPTIKDRGAELKDAARMKFTDSLYAFEDEARKKAKVDFAGMQDDLGAIDGFRRYKARANRSVAHRQLKWNGDEYENGKSLAEIFGGMDEDTEKAFNAYLLLKHAPDRIREGKPIFDNMAVYAEDGRTLLDLNDPEVCLREAEKRLKQHPEFAERAEEVYRYTRNELQNRVDAGLLPQKVAKEWNEKYPFYVPTGREGYFNGVHGDYGSVTGAGELKAAKGSDYDIWDIKQQLSDATTRNWRDMTLNNLFRRMFGSKTAKRLATEADGGVEYLLDRTINLSKSRQRGQYFADIFINGKKHRVEIDKRFYDCIEDMYKNGRLGNGLDTVNDILSKPAQVWKNLITEWSPIFMIKNFMRDFPEAVINTRQTKEFLESMGPALRDLFTNGEYSRALRNAGISQSTFIDLDKNLAKGSGRHGLKWAIEKGNELTEMYPRLVEYMATFKRAGVDIADASIALRNRAAANAADVTVNFGRSGSIGKMLNKGFVPFFNPSVQGWSKFLRNVTERESGKDLLKFLVKATALGAAPLALNNFLYRNNPNYQMISPRDKANNYIIPWPPFSDDTNVFIKIPRSRFASVYGLPVVNLFNENKMGWAEAVQIINDQVAPVDPIESHFGAQLIQAKNNKTWYGSPIVPKALEDLPKPEQYDANTSAIGKALGKMTEKLPEPLQISPKKADYVLDATTGILGDLVLPATTPSKQGTKGVFDKYVGTPMGNVLKRQFSIDSTIQNNLSTRFYDALDKANTANQSVHGGEKEKAEYQRLSAYSTGLSSVNSAITYLQNSDRPTRQEDVYGLQKVKNQLMTDALEGKPAPTSAEIMDMVHEYVGTTYAVNNFGSSADKEALKVYAATKYGNISEEEMIKKMDADKAFYDGVKAIGSLESRMSTAGVNSNTVLTKAVALASIGASDELYGAYKCTKQSRTETASKMDRAKAYFANGGSLDEYVQLETARKSLGKLSDFDKEAELDKALKQLKSGEISEAEYYEKKGEITYNANISSLGLAVSLAQINSPERGYRLYDIKSENIRKGINLAAMGYTARQYRNMAKAVDTDGNGYPSKKEIIAYVANSNERDKATLFDALYYYKGSGNPFGTPTRYSRAQAAATGKANGLDAISAEAGDFDLAEPESTGSGGYGGYGGYHGYGGGRRSRSKKVPALKKSNYKASSKTYKDIASTLKTRSSSIGASSLQNVKVEPPKVKFKKYEV